MFVVGAVAGGGDAVMTVGGPFNGITAEVFSDIQGSLSRDIPEFQGTLQGSLDNYCEEVNAYTQTSNQDVIAHRRPEQVVTGLVLDCVYE